MNKDIFFLPETRRLEFKETLPSGDRLAKTVVAFSNGSGGELYLGVQNEPREIVGLPEDQLIEIEEKVCNIISDKCTPTIIPDISFINLEGKQLLRIKIFPGNQPPYALKGLDKNSSVFIRVGSSNRAAGVEIIEELERKRKNISFDSIPLYEVPFDAEDFGAFTDFFTRKSNQSLADGHPFEKLGISCQEQDKSYTTVAGLLLSDNEAKQRLFPYAKIECARFKGSKTDTILDQVTCDGPLFEQIECTMSFIKRNISKSSTIGEIYREDHWEYPLKAIREMVINAVIHRDYSQLGRDIKVAIFDDMLEITSPGTLPASIEIEYLGSGQSEIRNRTLAPIFKMSKLIEQWGTGFSKVTEELNDYAELEVQYLEPGLSFQVQFSKKDAKHNAQTSEMPSTQTDVGPSWDQVGTKLGLSWDQVREILLFSKNQHNMGDIMNLVGWKNKTKFRDKFIYPLLEYELLEMTIPERPSSPNQEYRTTEKGIRWLAGFNQGVVGSNPAGLTRI